MSARSRMERRVGVRRSLPPPADRASLREQLGLNQEELAHAVGVSRQSVSHWENGVRNPNGKILARYLAVLGVLGEEAAARDCEAAIARVRALHCDDGKGKCRECGLGYEASSWGPDVPCPTIRALDGTTEPEGPPV